tara:strand:+ start:777 stop:1064 length:288 start_codon:yes stop_codon:yes gene_type:complete
MRMTVAQPKKIPCLRESERIFPISHVWIGRIFHKPKRRSAPTVLTLRKRLTKKAGMACIGAVRGLTRNRTMRSEVVENRAARLMPKRRLCTTGEG